MRRRQRPIQGSTTTSATAAATKISTTAPGLWHRRRWRRPITARPIHAEKGGSTTSAAGLHGYSESSRMLQMENNNQEQESESLSTGVFELPGEPAIVINGVPPYIDCYSVSSGIPSGSETQKNNKGFGEWLEGRQVGKLFEDKLYSGTVTNFDKDTGWYRVVYEDGDFEDLDWDELEQALLPLDIEIPLKALALKIIRKGQIPVCDSEKKKRGRTRKVRVEGMKSEGEASLMNFDEAEIIKAELQEQLKHKMNIRNPVQ